MSKAIGIDCGSTLSEVAIIEGVEPTVILTSEGSRTFPSVVCFDKKTGERKVGAPAKRQMLMNPKGTINLVKRLMGRRYDDEEVSKTKKHVQYDIVNHNGWAYVKIDDKEYSPQEISSWILGGLKKMAEDYSGEEIKDAVITVPAMFPDAARTATKEAGELAGLNVLRIINEPTAATLASHLDKEGVYLVADCGGSTTDFSAMDFDKESDTIEILASDGDTFLGGADFDNDVANYVIDEFKKTSGVDLSKDSMAMQRVMEGVEKAKIELSNSGQTEINLPYISVDENKTPVHLVQTLTKAKFEQLIKPDVDRLISCAKTAVDKAKKKKPFDNLDGIILVGGSCRIPYVQECLEKELGATLIKKADFDLAVAQGASIQANILAGNTSTTDILLLDVTPLSLGIETMGGVMTKLIEANSSIPIRKSEVFSTAVDNQTAVTVKVLQGERKMAADNKVLGVFNLDGIMPARRGVPQIEVTFDIDSSGIVSVTAKDKATNKEQHITIQDSAGLSKDDIEKIKADAEAHKAEDEKKEKEVQTLNQAESFVYNLEQTMKDAGDKITEDDKKSVEPLMEKVKQCVSDKDASGAEAALKTLQETFQPIAEKMYNATKPADGTDPLKDAFKNATTGADPTANPFTGDADTTSENGGNTEADFEEVKE